MGKKIETTIGNEKQPVAEPDLNVDASVNKKKGAKAALTELFMKYGKIAVVTHVCLSMFSFAAIYAAVSLGLDVDEILRRFGMEASSHTGAFAIALVLNKVTSPFRLPITIALTPIIANKLGKYQSTQNNDKQQQPSSEKNEILPGESSSQNNNTTDSELKTGHEIKTIDVVAGIIWKDNNNESSSTNNDEFLVQQIQSHKLFAGMWEFPGGKVESGETLQQALQRELNEELNIKVTNAHFWKEHSHYYSEKELSVRLHFFHVTGYEGQPQSMEGQNFLWYNNKTPSSGLENSVKFLEADDSIMKELQDFTKPANW